MERQCGKRTTQPRPMQAARFESAGQAICSKVSAYVSLSMHSPCYRGTRFTRAASPACPPESTFPEDARRDVSKAKLPLNTCETSSDANKCGECPPVSTPRSTSSESPSSHRPQVGRGCTCRRMLVGARTNCSSGPRAACGNRPRRMHRVRYERGMKVHPAIV